MIEVPLTQGFVALVDDRDADLVLSHKWCADRVGSKVYAYAKVLMGGSRRTCRMHRLIMDPSPGLHVDHINRDGLDNRRANLRVVTPGVNFQNRPPRGGASRYLGVSRNKKRWKASIGFEGKFLHLGTFDTEEQAAVAYDVAAKKLYGRDAALNLTGGSA